MSTSAPVLTIACGLTGTGKSTILNDVAERKGSVIMASDMIRKQLVGIEPGEHRYESFDSGIYSPEFTERTYRYMISEGRKLLLEGRSVILDACFPKKWQREEARVAAVEVGARFVCIEFTAEEEEVRPRLDKRFQGGKGVSDGRWEIYVAQKKGFEDVDEFGSDEHFVIDTAEPVEDCVRRILEILE